MNKREIELICEITVNKLFEKMKGRVENTTPEYVTCKEAARILGISEIRLRARKAEFPHIKGNNGSQQGHLLFLRSALLSTYQNI